MGAELYCFLNRFFFLLNVVATHKAIAFLICRVHFDNRMISLPSLQLMNVSDQVLLKLIALLYSLNSCLVPETDLSQTQK